MMSAGWTTQYFLPRRISPCLYPRSHYVCRQSHLTWQHLILDQGCCSSRSARASVGLPESPFLAERLALASTKDWPERAPPKHSRALIICFSSHSCRCKSPTALSMDCANQSLSAIAGLLRTLKPRLQGRYKCDGAYTPIRLARLAPLQYTPPHAKGSPTMRSKPSVASLISYKRKAGRWYHCTHTPSPAFIICCSLCSQ